MADKNEEEQKPFNPHPIDDNNQPKLTDEQLTPVRDGAVPQNAEGIASGQFDALDPVGNAEIKFNQGNYQTIMGLPKVAADKVAQLVQTLVPLLEISMIELLGANNLYQRALGQCMPSFDSQGKMGIEFTFQYIVEQWIGQDIDQQAIQHDANYVLERIKPVKANITKCEINVGEGTLIVMGSI